MAKKTTSVFIWLPGHTQPVCCGQFSWSPETRIGEFVYAPDYLSLSHAQGLDPINLRLRRSVVREARQDGIFGIFRDAGPDAWGRDQLYRQYGVLDEFDYLLRGPGDAVGNLSFGQEPRPFAAYTLTALDEVSRGFPPEDAVLDHVVHPTTSMGGAKPKLLIEDAGAFWIAKFPEKGDPRRFLAANEHVMLLLARLCGIDTASSRLHTLPDGRQILLVRRFDLERTVEGVKRKGFASAYTVLGLGNPREDGNKKSYLRLADEALRWTGQSQGALIWQRLLFNAMVGNIDDHPRNHALISDERGWQFSPAFDIVATERRDHVALSMSFHRQGALATPQTLLEAAVCLGIEPDAAIAQMRSMANSILERWESCFVDVDAETEAVHRLASAFTIARQVQQHAFSSADIPLRTDIRRYRRR